ncbi:CLUMA_CG002266, isoform A [Clunio marinus]|uniref:CLUMA_CG002266, isoform A n=1 Tax=Clunio marinus TaxID=568069 RepID=A0A1J1HK98_9DIPT|nr:CLUMA_CG002266, isoform A [Clunio marinus]
MSTSQGLILSQLKFLFLITLIVHGQGRILNGDIFELSEINNAGSERGPLLLLTDDQVQAAKRNDVNRYKNAYRNFMMNKETPEIINDDASFKEDQISYIPWRVASPQTSRGGVMEFQTITKQF